VSDLARYVLAFCSPRASFTTRHAGAQNTQGEDAKANRPATWRSASAAWLEDVRDCVEMQGLGGGPDDRNRTVHSSPIAARRDRCLCPEHRTGRRRRGYWVIIAIDALCSSSDETHEPCLQPTKTATVSRWKRSLPMLSRTSPFSHAATMAKHATGQGEQRPSRWPMHWRWLRFR
jgi:hypothetical protein